MIRNSYLATNRICSQVCRRDGSSYGVLTTHHSWISRAVVCKSQLKARVWWSSLLWSARVSPLSSSRSHPLVVKMRVKCLNGSKTRQYRSITTAKYTTLTAMESRKTWWRQSPLGILFSYQWTWSLSGTSTCWGRMRSIIKTTDCLVSIKKRPHTGVPFWKKQDPFKRIAKSPAMDEEFTLSFTLS